MTTPLEEIRNAVDSGNVDGARQLLRDELTQQPSAEVYYLASKVAINQSQRVIFLQKTIAADPFHEQAHDDLAEANGSQRKVLSPGGASSPEHKEKESQTGKTPADSAEPATQPSKGTAYVLRLNPTFDMATTLLMVAIGFSVAQLVAELDWILGIAMIVKSNKNLLDFIMYPIAGLIAGATTARAIKQLLPEFEDKRSNVMIGWMVAWFVQHVISYLLPPIPGLLGDLAGNALEGFLVATVMQNSIQSFLNNKRVNIMSGWMASYAVMIAFYALTSSSDVPTHVVINVVGSILTGLIGCGLTLKQLRKQLAS